MTPDEVAVLLRVISELAKMRDGEMMSQHCRLSILVMDLERLAGLPVDEHEYKQLVSKMRYWDRCATGDYP